MKYKSEKGKIAKCWKNKFHRLMLWFWIYGTSDNGKISRPKIAVLEQFMYPDWIFLCKRRCPSSKNEYHDYRRAGGVPSLNQKSQATLKSEDELRRTRGNPNGIYGKRKEENSPELLNSGGARTNSGQIRLMQRPLLRQRRRWTAAAELGC